MNGITYYRLNSDYSGDITKNCALTGIEVDNNFYTLEGRDIESVEFQDGKLIINLKNGQSLSTERIDNGMVSDITFDETTGTLTVQQGDETKVIGGFTTSYNTTSNNFTVMDRTGQYRPVKHIINTLENEQLPTTPNVGDRYITIEIVNSLGYLYNYNGLCKIECALRSANSQWRVPTKADWDAMLNAVEPNERCKNHTNTQSNAYLGCVAGKLLKSSTNWREDENQNGQNDGDSYSTPNHSNCTCGNNCNPSYVGELGSCGCCGMEDCNGIDYFGFNVLPVGYANEDKEFVYFTDRAYFWSTTNNEYRDAYAKAFVYNKCSVLQDMIPCGDFLSIRLVKDFTGDNYSEYEEILGCSVPTTIMNTESGKTVWTCANISIAANGTALNADYIHPNELDGIESVIKYFTNEWNGNSWLRKEIKEGESVVVFEVDGEDGYVEYRLCNNELVNVNDNGSYEDIIALIDREIGSVRTEISGVSDSVSAEVERATAKETEIEGSITSLQESVNFDIYELHNEDTRIEGMVNNLSSQLSSLEVVIGDTSTSNLTIIERLNAIETTLAELIDFGEYGNGNSHTPTPTPH